MINNEIIKGISTKVAQVVAYELGVPITFITVTQTSTSVIPNAGQTASSITSSLNCLVLFSFFSFIHFHSFLSFFFLFFLFFLFYSYSLFRQPFKRAKQSTKHWPLSNRQCEMQLGPR